MLWRMFTAAIIKYCSPPRHTKWKVDVILTLGTFELFELLARRNGPMEGGCDYAMEKDEWKQNRTKGKTRTRRLGKQHTPGKKARNCAHKMNILGVSADTSQSGLFFSTPEDRNTKEGRQARTTIHAIPLELKVICSMETAVISHISHDAVLCFVAMVTANLSVFSFQVIWWFLDWETTFPALAFSRLTKTCLLCV